MHRESVIGAWLAAFAVVGLVLATLSVIPERNAPAHDMNTPLQSAPVDQPPAFDHGVHYWQEDRDQPRPAWPQGRPSV